jgi:hypothetical protein
VWRPLAISLIHYLTYSPSVASSISSGTVGLKPALIAKYSGVVENGVFGDEIWCMMLKMFLPRRVVIGSHLFKKAWHRCVCYGT